MNDFYKANSITNESILVIGFNNYIKQNNIGITNYNDDGVFELVITSDELDKSIKNIFGNISYTKNSFVYGMDDVTYNSSKNNFTLNSGPSGCEGLYDKVFTKVSKISKQDNNIYLEEQVLFGKADEDAGVYKLYNNNNYSTLLNTISHNQNPDIETFNKGSIYIYTFTKVNDNYIFRNVEKK